jgi:hypothetical protein
MTLDPRLIAGTVPASVLPEALNVAKVVERQGGITPRPGAATAACEALSRAGLLTSDYPGHYVRNTGYGAFALPL